VILKTGFRAGFFLCSFVGIIYLTMKKLIPAVLMSLLFVVACKKDEDKKDGGTNSSNKFTYNSVDFVTPTGFLEIYQTDSGDNHIDRDVVFSNFTKEEYTGEDVSFNNKNMVYLDLGSNLNTSELEVGTYVYSEERAPMTIVYAGVLANVSYNKDTEITTVGEGGIDTEDLEGNITSGSVTVTKSGNDFVFDYDVNLGDKNFKGLYSGSLEITYNENDSTNGIRPNTDFLHVRRDFK
jgi:hypothetical protein